jgi:hypothetical protein
MKRVLALAATLLLAGCGIVPAPDTALPTATAPASEVQRGMVLPTWERHGYRDPDTVPALHELAALGAGWVQLVPTWYQSGRTSSALRPTDGTVADGELRMVVEAAHAAGLRVLLKPHVDVADGTDRALIDPSDRAAWFRSYRAFITDYARLASELGVEQFAVGTELEALSGDRVRWLDVVAAVRTVYRGELVYAANHTEYQTVSFWDAVDLIGIDVYWSLAPSPTTDVELLERALAVRRDELEALAARYHRRILFTEAGFPSQRGAATAPWDGLQSTVPAQDEQAAAYEALLATFTGQPWWAGVFWWTWTVAHRHDVDTPQALDHSVRGKLAADVLMHWWATGLGATAGATVGR